MSETIRANILDRAAQGTLLHGIFHEYGKHWFDEADPTIATLAELHNQGSIDLLAILTPETLEPYKGEGFFRGQHVYCALISRLEAPAETLMNVVQALIEAAGNDLAAGLPVEEFAKWCARKPGRPAELLSLIDRKVPNADRYLTIAIKNGVSVDRDYFLDRAYALLVSGTDVEKQAAANALGQVLLSDSEDWDRLLKAFSALLDSDPDDSVRSSFADRYCTKIEWGPCCLSTTAGRAWDRSGEATW